MNNDSVVLELQLRLRLCYAKLGICSNFINTGENSFDIDFDQI